MAARGSAVQVDRAVHPDIEHGDAVRRAVGADGREPAAECSAQQDLDGSCIHREFMPTKIGGRTHGPIDTNAIVLSEGPFPGASVGTDLRDPTCCNWSHNVIRYSWMILGFRDTETARIWRGERSRHLPSDIQNVALRKLRLLNQSRELTDLSVPPGNRLEALKAERSGQHSIRINDQWRICFVWTAGGPKDVEIVDYHR